MKANFIRFWCVESEIIVKNWFHNWTSVLESFGTFLEKYAIFGPLWVLQYRQHMLVASSVFLKTGSCQCSSTWNEPNFPKMCQMHPNSDFQQWNLFFIQILHIKNEWNLPSLSLILFFFNHIEFRTMCPGTFFVVCIFICISWSLQVLPSTTSLLFTLLWP